LLPIFFQKLFNFFKELGFFLFTGVMMHHLFLNKSAKPASGPLCSVPATG